MTQHNNFIPVAQPDLSGNEKKYLLNCLSSSWISSKGKFINNFEESFAKFIGSKFAISTSNGTTALHLAVAALGIGKGDEVIVPDLTFIASANVVSYTGAKPVLVDVDRQTWNIDPDKIEQSISKRTKAILVVHLYGYPANMNKTIPLAKKHNLFVIEDAAEAHGAEIRMRLRHLGGGRMDSRPKGGGIWRKVGSIGDVGCFSFYGNKIITTGEGGIVVTNNRKLAEKIRILRDHGQTPTRRYYHEVIGFNYRMTNLQAAIGCAQLERIEEFIERKRKIARLYNSHLKNIPGITLPPGTPWAKSVYWLYSILINKPYPKGRDQLIELLLKENIESRPFFYPLHQLPPYKQKGNFPNANFLSKSGISLPSSCTLTDEEIEKIAGIIKRLEKRD